MKLVGKLFIMVWFVLAAVGAVNAQTMNAKDEAAIKRVVLAVGQALNDHDIKAYSEQFWDDADWINVMGMHWRGKANVVAAHEAYMSTVFHNGGYTYSDLIVNQAAANVAVVVKTEHTIEQTSPSGFKIPAGDDRLSFVVVKRNGKWKVLHGHNTPVDARAKPFDPIESHWRPKSQ